VPKKYLLLLDQTILLHFNSGKEFSEITENNKSRKIKEFISKAETALWFVESYGLVP
jgi:hypothetical protein